MFVRKKPAPNPHRPMRASPLLTVGIPCSLVLHVGLYAAAPAMRVPRRAPPLRTTTTVDVEMLDAPLEEPASEAPPDSPSSPPADTPAQVAASPSVQAPRRVEPSPPELTTEPEPAVSEPVSFDDITLTNPSPAGAWKVQQGSNPFNPASASPEPGPQPTNARPSGGHGNDRVVPLGDLSRPPTPPDLTQALARNYPGEARAQGAEGTTLLRARVNSDGSVGSLGILEETPANLGFASACAQTLRRSRWSPPQDASGAPVATHITYRCTFRLR